MSRAALMLGLGFLVALLSGPIRAEPRIPDGVFVKDSADTVWLVLDGRRVRVPIYPATHDEVVAIPVNGQWLVPQDGAVVLGSQPEWLNADREGEARTAGLGSASFEGLTVSLLQLSRGWLPPFTSIRPKPGMEYLTIEVRLVNTGDQTRRYSASDFQIDLDDGSRWERRLGRSPDLLLGTIATGASAQGWLTFEIPTGRPTVQLIWNARRDYALAIPL
jgi:hypothetical protein